MHPLVKDILNAKNAAVAAALNSGNSSADKQSHSKETSPRSVQSEANNRRLSVSSFDSAGSMDEDRSRPFLVALRPLQEENSEQISKMEFECNSQISIPFKLTNLVKMFYTFWPLADFRIPRRRRDRSDLSAGSSSPNLAGAAGVPRKLSILVVEDNPINQRVMLRMLDKLGYQDISVANNGIQALAQLEKRMCNTILMDSKQ